MCKRPLTPQSPFRGMTPGIWVTWGVVCLVSSVTVPIDARAAAGFLSPFRAFPTAPEGATAAVADFNSDTHPDVVILTRNPGAVSLMAGRGDGTFGTGSELVVGTNPGALVSGDLNGDGRPDLAVARGGTPTTITVILANGVGGFDAPIDVGSHSGGLASLILADLDDDGHLDLLGKSANSPTSSSIVGLFGNGDGTFGPVAILSAGAPASATVTVGDLNSDGAVDLIVARPGNGATLYTLMGNGDGTFLPPRSFTSFVTTPACPVVGDFNNDGHLDVAIANHGVGVHPGLGDGSLGPMLLYATSANVSSMVAADVNGDGKLDLVLGNGVPQAPPSFGTIKVLLGDGNGSFGGAFESATGGLPLDHPTYDPGFVAVADLDRNGTLDVVAVNRTSNTISVHSGNGDGTFGSSMSVPGGLYPWAIATGDFDGDGMQDLVTSHPDSTLSLHAGNGPDAFRAWVAFGCEHMPGRLQAGDLNRDGIDDLVSMNLDSTISVRYGSHAGLGPAVDYAGRPYPRSMALADLNGDGFPDLVTTSGYVGSTVASRPYISVFLGREDGGFEPRRDQAPAGFLALAGVGDMNEDQRPDLVVVYDSGSLAVMSGNGDGTFGTELPGPPGAGRGKLADFDEDGRLDVVVAGDNRMLVMRGMGNGTLGAPMEYLGPSMVHDIAVADFDQDGHADVALASAYRNSVTVYCGRGDGTFQDQEIHGASGGPVALAIGDWNQDGRPDVATADEYSSRISILRNPVSVAAVKPVPTSASAHLGAAYPNPARVSLAIPFETVTAGDAAIRVYDLAGRIVKVVMEERLPAGRHVVAWDVRTTQGRVAPPGVYFYELTLGRERRAKRVTIVR